MSYTDDITEQLELLRIHRDTLSILLKQQAMHGVASVPSAMVHNILEARRNIKRITTVLRSWGVSVPEHPNDANEQETLSHSAEINVFKIDLPIRSPDPPQFDLSKTDLPYPVPGPYQIDLSKVNLPYQIPETHQVDLSKINLPYQAPDPYQVDLFKINLPYQVPDLPHINSPEINILDLSPRFTEATSENNTYELIQVNEEQTPKHNSILIGIWILVLGGVFGLFSYLEWASAIWAVIIFAIGIIVLLLGNHKRS